MNSTIDKIDPATPANQTRGKWYNTTARGTSWTWFFGAMAGVAVGVLNLLAADNQWRLQDGFDVIDAQITALIDAAEERLGIPHWLAYSYDTVAWLAIICYWIGIGTFLSSLLCLARERTCRRALLFGAGGGFLIGSLNLLATTNGWFEIWRLGFLDHLTNAARKRMVYSHLFGRDVNFGYWRLTFLGDWVLIGLLLVSLFCVVRTLMRKKAASRVLLTTE